MRSVIADTLELKFSPVAISRTDVRPRKALQFKEGKRACSMFLFCCAAHGRTAVADRHTCGCVGGTAGLGFGDAYQNFPGGVQGFCGFLSSGNRHTEQGRALGEKLAARSAEFSHHYLHGEGYKRSPDLVQEWHDALPIQNEGPSYVVFRPLADVKPEEEDAPDVVAFVVDPDQLSSLVVLANYGTPRSDGVIIPFGSGCQLVCLLPFAEAAREHPRAVVGLTDLSARKAVRRQLGPEMLTFAMPWKLFLEMEQNAPDCFFNRPTFAALLGKECGINH